MIGGDFNTNHDQEIFASERTLDSLAAAGYQSRFEGLSLPERLTHPGIHGFPDATFDFISTGTVEPLFGAMPPEKIHPVMT